VYWFLVFAEREVHAGAGSSIQRRWKSPWDVRRFNDLLSERRHSRDMLLGGTTDLMMEGRPNFVYENDMICYCTWFSKVYEPRNVFNAPGYSFLGVWSDGTWSLQLAASLPPFPAVDGVWFVGEQVRPALSVPASVSTRMCVGCNAQGVAPTIRCKTCGQGYCGHECHGRNWRSNCGGCAKKGAAAKGK
jgi:hypothetical protein